MKKTFKKFFEKLNREIFTFTYFNPDTRKNEFHSGQLTIASVKKLYVICRDFLKTKKDTIQYDDDADISIY